MGHMDARIVDKEHVVAIGKTGCVMEWGKYEAVSMAPRWPNTSTMLAEIAEALEHGTDVDDYHPDPHDGILDWV